jgi:hypothetical protein
MARLVEPPDSSVRNTKLNARLNAEGFFGGGGGAVQNDRSTGPDGDRPEGTPRPNPASGFDARVAVDGATEPPGLEGDVVLETPGAVDQMSGRSAGLG